MSDTFLKERFGVFNGKDFVDDEDGRVFPVSPNYASKSKMVAGDKLKMVMTENGFIWKQIAPVLRRQFIGRIVLGVPHEYTPAAENTGSHTPKLMATNAAETEYYRILGASVSYFGLHVGDEVVVIVPKEGRPEWCAIETNLSKYR